MNILAFFAHPDDETMLNGGTLAILANQGAHVHYLCATRGEGGEAGEPPVCTLEELGETREREMVCAVQALRGRSLTFLSYIDPRVGENDQLFPFTEDVAMLGGQIANSIRQFSIAAVITHGVNGEYGHPAHIVCHKAALVAALSFEEGKRPLLYTAAADFPDHPKPRLANPDNPAHLVLDVSSVREQKLAAALCHRSQHALFVRRTSKRLGRTVTVAEVMLDKEGVHRLLPAVNSPVDDPVANLLREAGVVLASS